MSVKEEIHAQIVGGLACAKFPIKTPEQLLSAFPNGANTTCKAGDLEVSDQHEENKTCRKKRSK